MKSFNKLLLPYALCVVAGIAHADPLKFSDLDNHPERWPQSVTLKRDFQFEGGASVRKGQTAEVLDVSGAKVRLSTGDLVFAVSPNDCDLLSAANQEWGALTPAQKAVTATTLVQDTSLWPSQVRMTRTVKFDGGTSLPQGEATEFVSITGNDAKVFSPRLNTLFTLGWRDTDLIAQARQRALKPLAERPSRVAGLLRGKLVSANGNMVTTNLDNVKVFALYYGASWCGPCRQFTPGFIAFVNRVSAQNPNFAVVMMSSDEQVPDMLGYMKEEKMPWPALPLAEREKMALPRSYGVKTIPQLIIVDNTGKELASSYDRKNETSLGPDVALQALTKILDSGAAR